jgi:hypothetical protein
MEVEGPQSVAIYSPCIKEAIPTGYWGHSRRDIFCASIGPDACSS